ncbi:hypothetical protein JCM6882_008585 [Rhodosporidiobolus microsporus]
MAIHNQLAFVLLTFEIALFSVLVVPLPFTWRRALLKTIAESHIIAKIQWGFKIAMVFVSLLFADAVNQMLKIHRERELTAQVGAAAPDMRAQSDYRSRKFLSERNFYLHGSCLFLALILSRTYSLVLDLVKAQEELAIVKAQHGDAAAKADLPKDGQRVGETKKKVETVTVEKDDKKRA